MKKITQTIIGISAKTWLYLFIVSAVLFVIALRNNNLTMSKLREEVYAADKNNGDVNAALNKLRLYVYSHMNTNLSSGNNNIKPPIQLKYTYQRYYDEQFNQMQSANQKIYEAAKKACKANTSGFDPSRMSCISNYAVNNGVRGADIKIPAGLYQFDFVSPAWSPDLAGWSLVASIIFLLAFVIKFLFSKVRI